VARGAGIRVVKTAVRVLGGLHHDYRRAAWTTSERMTRRLQRCSRSQRHSGCHRTKAPGTALGGVTLKACNAEDTECVDPIAATISDDNGVATVTVPTGTVGFDGYLDAQMAGRISLILAFNRKSSPRPVLLRKLQCETRACS
jgi:hypothetical protein